MLQIILLDRSFQYIFFFFYVIFLRVSGDCVRTLCNVGINCVSVDRLYILEIR